MPAPPHSIYVLGIAGTGVGALAGLLKAAGHRVHGVDAHAYPPMRDKLREWGIPVHLGYDPAHLTPPPDLVIVGNVVRRDNPEAAAVRAQHLPAMSMPQAIAEFAIGERHSVVISGTHGKTTTTALTAHVLQRAGRDPGFLVGGALVGQRESFALGTGPFVIEGDEYDTAYFDKGAKFLHYRAKTLVITSLEFDHADIYESVEAIEAAFGQLIAQMPQGGHVIVWRGAERALHLLAARGQHLQVTVYDALAPGQSAAPHPLLPNAAMLWATQTTCHAQGLTLTAHGHVAGVAHPIDWPLSVALWGDFGAQNTMAAVAVSLAQGLSREEIAQGLQSFRGVSRRLEERVTVAGRTIVDDFAHHPTAVAATLAAARQRFAGRRLWAIFEPRSATSRRNIFFREYLAAFGQADVVLIAHHERLGEVPLPERFDPQALAAALGEKGIRAAAPANNDAIVAYVQRHAEAGDVILVLSNGDFDGLLERLSSLIFSPTGAR